MFIKWLILSLSFILCLVALEIYRNTTLMDRGYSLQELRAKKKLLIEENGYLQEKLSFHLSLSRLQDYARKELELVTPEKVRFLKENFSPPKRSSSPPPFSIETSLKNWISQIVKRLKRWFDILL